MTRRFQFLTAAIGALMLSGGTALAGGGHGDDDANFCMNVETEAFYMVPSFVAGPGTCPVQDYWDGELQQAFYPFTTENHLFNCDYFGDVAPLPTGDMVPSWVVSNGEITGEIDGHPFSATLYCASLTNWYQDSCEDPEDPNTCSVQLMQPFLAATVPYHVRVTEVSVLDGALQVTKGREVPFVMATRAAGITHLESLDPESTQVGASITHSLLGLVTYKSAGDKIKDVEVLDGSLDLLLQGHIFYPPELEDPNPARIYGTICSEELYNLLKKGKKGKKHGDDDDD